MRRWRPRHACGIREVCHTHGVESFPDIYETRSLAMQALIVEDSRVVATILRARLERAGFQVGAATNASEGWHMFQSARPQLVTLDIVMPSVDGLDAFLWLPKTPKAAKSLEFWD